MISNTPQKELRNEKIDSLDVADLRTCLTTVGYLPEANIIPPILETTLRSSPASVSKQIAEPIVQFVTKTDQQWRDFKIIKPENYLHTVNLTIENYHKVTRVMKRSTKIFSYSVPITYSNNSERSGKQIKQWVDLQRELLTSSSKNRLPYLLQVDIQSCYHTMYTHAIEWAFSSTNNKKFGSKLDESIRRGNLNRTHGLPVGPYISDLIAESVLCWVDKNIETSLTNIGCTGYRFKDNYYFLCKNTTDATAALSAVASELRRAHFTINESKTDICLFTDFYSFRWQNGYDLILESLSLSAENPVFTDRKLKVFIQQVISLSQKHGNSKSILEKAITLITASSVTGFIDYKWLFYALGNMLPLRSLSYPKILTYIKKLAEENPFLLDSEFEEFMINEIDSAAKRKDTYALLWIAYILHDNKYPTPRDRIYNKLTSLKPAHALVDEMIKYLDEDHSSPILWATNDSALELKHAEHKSTDELYNYLAISFGES